MRMLDDALSSPRMRVWRSDFDSFWRTSIPPLLPRDSGSIRPGGGRRNGLLGARSKEEFSEFCKPIRRPRRRYKSRERSQFIRKIQNVRNTDASDEETK